MLKKMLTAATVTAALTALATAPAHGATLPVAGWGWKLTSEFGVTSLSPSRQYTVTFASETLRQRYTPLLTAAVAQVNTTGVKLAVGGVEPVDVTKCGPVGHVQVTEMYRPYGGKPGYSRAMPCPNPVQGVGTGGLVIIDSEYWDGTWTMDAYKRHNTVVHETLHALGLDHPNVDLDKDGVVEDYECVKTAYNNAPLMCSPNGGYKTADMMGKLVGYDINGLKALITNAKTQGIK